MDSSGISNLVDGILAHDRASIARALRWIDEVPEKGQRLVLEALKRGERRAHIVGITGNPGAGKSTVLDGLLRLWRDAGKRVAVLAIDPSSPFTGGALLGDRIRMMRHTLDDGVYIRSLATRGALGGLSRSAHNSVCLLDLAGFDLVVVETVGVGQDEVDVVRLAHTTVVVMVPGLGDDIQAFKAGLLEIADLFLLNKADRPGVDELERSLRQLLSLAPQVAGAWKPKILRGVALEERGLDSLITGLATHREYLNGDMCAELTQQRRLAAFDRLVDEELVRWGRNQLASQLATLRSQVATGELAAIEAIAAAFHQERGA